jgi:hypothetical protein
MRLHEIDALLQLGLQIVINILGRLEEVGHCGARWSHVA